MGSYVDVSTLLYFTLLCYRSHILARVAGFKVGKGFSVQPLNGFGEPDGKSLVESSQHVSLLPEPDAVVTVYVGNTRRELDLRVGGYMLPNQEVTCAPVEGSGAAAAYAPPVEGSGAAAADAPPVPRRSPRKRARRTAARAGSAARDSGKRSRTVNANAKVKPKVKPKTKDKTKGRKRTVKPKVKPKTKTKTKTKPKVKPKTKDKTKDQTKDRKRKGDSRQVRQSKRKRSMDRGSSSTTGDDTPSPFTLSAVFESFANPRGSHMITHI